MAKKKRKKKKTLREAKTPVRQGDIKKRKKLYDEILKDE